MILNHLPPGQIHAFPTHIRLHHFGDPNGIVLHLPARDAADAANIAAAIHQLPDLLQSTNPIDLTCRARDSLTSVIEIDSLDVLQLFDQDTGLLWIRGLGLIAGPG